MINEVFFPGLGLELTLNRVAFHVFGRPVYWYGIIIASGLLLAVWLCSKWGKRFGITEDQITDMMLFAVPAALISIRAYYVIFNLGQYRNADGSLNWGAVFRYSDGGLAIYGGIISGLRRPGGSWTFYWAAGGPVGQLYECGGLRRPHCLAMENVLGVHCERTVQPGYLDQRGGVPVGA